MKPNQFRCSICREVRERGRFERNKRGYVVKVCKRRECGKAAARALAILTLLCLAGCGRHYQALSSGSVGCAPDDIGIDHVGGSGAAVTWQATCRGQAFACTEVGQGPVNCTQEVAP